MPNQYDKIKQQTREKIYRAFFTLLDQKLYHDITVRELAKQADIGFRTFYHHFDDKDALADAIVEQALSEVAAVIQPVASLDDAEDNVRRVVELAQARPDFVLALWQLPEREKRLAPLMQKAAWDMIEMRDDNPDSTEMKMLGHHFTYTQLNLIHWWIANDTPLPPESMVQYIMQLVMRPVWHFNPD